MTKEDIKNRFRLGLVLATPFNVMSKESQDIVVNTLWKESESYAKQEAIGFGKWLSLNYYLDDGGFYHHDYQNKTRFTIEELYELYIQSKK